MPEQSSECYCLVRGRGDYSDAVDCEDETCEDFHDMDLSSIEENNSGATFVRTRVRITNSAFVVAFVLESPSWGKATVGVRAMSRIGGSYNLRKLDPCSHQSKDVHQILSETKPGSNIYLSAGPDPIFSATALNKSRHKSLRMDGYFILPTSGSVAGRWLPLCLWEDQHKVVRVRHPHTCLQCVFHFAKEKFAAPGSTYSSYTRQRQRIFLF